VGIDLAQLRREPPERPHIFGEFRIESATDP
jgi:hypothetical protein